MDKSFKLTDLELAGPQTTSPAYDPAAPPPVEATQTVKAALAPHVSALQSLGWHVELTETSVSLHLIQEQETEKGSGRGDSLQRVRHRRLGRWERPAGQSVVDAAPLRVESQFRPGAHVRAAVARAPPVPGKSAEARAQIVAVRQSDLRLSVAPVARAPRS